MKRIMIRPGKSVVVSDEAFGRARDALQAFGVDAAAFKRLGEFKGDVTIGAQGVGPKPAKLAKATRAVKAVHFKIFKSRVAKAAQGLQAAQTAAKDRSTPFAGMVVGEPAQPERRRRLLKVGA